MKRLLAGIVVCILVLVVLIPIGIVIVKDQVQPCRYYTAPATFESISSTTVKNGRHSSLLWPVGSYSYKIAGVTYNSSKILCQSSPYAVVSSMFARRLVSDVQSGQSIAVNIPRDNYANGCISLTNDANYQLFSQVSPQCHAPNKASQ